MPGGHAGPPRVSHAKSPNTMPLSLGPVLPPHCSQICGKHRLTAEQAPCRPWRRCTIQQHQIDSSVLAALAVDGAPHEMLPYQNRSRAWGAVCRHTFRRPPALPAVDAPTGAAMLAAVLPVGCGVDSCAVAVRFTVATLAVGFCVTTAAVVQGQHRVWAQGGHPTKGKATCQQVSFRWPNDICTQRSQAHLQQPTLAWAWALVSGLAWAWELAWASGGVLAENLALASAGGWAAVWAWA